MALKLGFGRGPSAELRVWFLALLMLVGLAGLVGKLWYEQVLRGPKWTAKLRGRGEKTVRIPSVRGEIRDRNGVTLVSNRASYEVDFYLRDMVKGYRELTGTVPQVDFELIVKQMRKKKKEPDIVRIVNESVIPRLKELDLARDYNSERLQRHYRNDTEVPFTYFEIEKEDFATIAKFAEHNVGLPGVEIAAKPVRQYLYGAFAAHLLGYVGAPNDIDRLPDVKKYSFYQPDVEGKSQVEYHLDRWIRGTPGKRVLQTNVKGVIEGEIVEKREAPKQGNNVYLTIDARIQFIAERALREAGVGRAAAVVVNPKNGDILAMASVPSYDPNDFIPSISAEQWKVLTDDETDPLTNRAIQGYAPGSTYKAVTALAGLRARISPDRAYNCSGGVQYGGKYMKCWIKEKGGAHGTLTLPEALKVSCNAYFYQFGNAAGIEEIDTVGDQLGLGKKTAVPLTGESSGILPGPEWLKLIEPNARWSQGYTANVSIGQGAVEASPLQMTMVTATIANRGISYEPRLIHRVVDQEGRDVKDEDGRLVAPPEPKVRANLRASGVSEEQIEAVREGMKRVVNTPGGTGKRAQVKGITVAGKTGTAQFWRESEGKKIKDNHTWFICFAPYEDPKFAITVFVQGAKSGGGVSAPIVQKILEESLALEKGYEVTLAALEPAIGSFTPIEMVDFKQSAVPANIAGQLTDDDQERSDHTDAPPEPTKKKSKQVAARPDIRAGADARGRVSKAQAVARPAAEKRGFFQRFFGGGSSPPKPAPQPRPGGR
jgi:penicillin-binding protein 2